MTRIALIAAAAALAIPAIASAEPKPEADTAPVTAAAVAVRHAPRYCVVDEATTGTRLERRTCKSLEAWLAEGYDPRVRK